MKKTLICILSTFLVLLSLIWSCDPKPRNVDLQGGTGAKPLEARDMTIPLKLDFRIKLATPRDGKVKVTVLEVPNKDLQRYFKKSNLMNFDMVPFGPNDKNNRCKGGGVILVDGKPISEAEYAREFLGGEALGMPYEFTFTVDTVFGEKRSDIGINSYWLSLSLTTPIGVFESNKCLYVAIENRE